MKGIATPLALYRVSKESEAHSRFEVVVRKGLTPLVGREHEFGLLRERWVRVKDGAGQVVLLSGEPGIGKSRLVEALKETIEQEGARCLELRCSPYAQNSALQPVIEYLQRVLQFHPDDTPTEKLQKLEHILGRQARLDTLSDDTAERVIASAAKQSLQGTEIASSPPAPRNDTNRLQEMVSLFASLLSLPAPRSLLPALSPEKQKEKTLEALAAWLCAETKQHAVTYAWEDLHWADPSTLELLTLFLAQIPTTRLLAVLTFRPEFAPPWGAHSYLSQLTLSRLGRGHVETMVGKVTGGEILSQEIIQQIVSKTDGVPLFVEELTKSVVESVGAHSRLPLQLGIPATLQDALMARLDRLGTAKEIAQLGATLGREFNYELLTAVAPLPEDILQQGLKQLVESELVYQSGIPPQARYLFKHALVQDTAYQSLLKSRRQQLHQQVAQVLAEQFPQTIETQPELVAHHYTEAGLIVQAIPYWQRAGARANQRSAYEEAIRHLTRGLELLQTLPDTPARGQLELTLRLAMGTPLVATKSWASPEVGRHYTQASELCQQFGDTQQLFSVLVGQWAIYALRAEHSTARALAVQLPGLAQKVNSQPSLILAHAILGFTLFFLGEFLMARDHMEQCIALYDPQNNSPLVSGAVNDPKVQNVSFAAWTLGLLGYPDQALKRIQEALTLARELAHPYSLAYALAVTARLDQFHREPHAVQDRAEELITLARAQGFPHWLAEGIILRGWALAEQGQRAEGIAQIRQGLATWRATGPKYMQPHFLTLLAEMCGKGEQLEEGLSVLAEALAAVDKTGERYYEAELYRLKGELTLQKLSVISSQLSVTDPRPLTPDPEVEAEACFLKAIDIACKQQAKSLELRAATSLARLWQQQGKRAEAHQMLSEVYNWFTKGFDTKDLQEAKALLEELSH